MKQTKTLLTALTTVAFFSAILFFGCNNAETKKEPGADSIPVAAPATQSNAAMPDTPVQKKDTGKGGQTVPGDQNPKPPKN